MRPSSASSSRMSSSLSGASWPKNALRLFSRSKDMMVRLPMLDAATPVYAMRTMRPARPDRSKASLAACIVVVLPVPAVPSKSTGALNAAWRSCFPPGDFGQLPPVAVAAEKTLLHARPLQTGQSREEVNLGLRLFLGIKNVFRCAASTGRWASRRTRTCCFASVMPRTRRRTFSCGSRRPVQRPALRRACSRARLRPHPLCLVRGELGDDGAAQVRALRPASLHLAQGAHVMLVLNLRTCWNLVNGLRGTVVGPPRASAVRVSCVAWRFGRRCAQKRACFGNRRLVRTPGRIRSGGLLGYIGPEMIPGQPTWVLLQKETVRHQQYPALSRAQFPIVLAYGITVHKSQGLTLRDGCVFNVDHEPTWSPLKCLGLAFVGMSRATLRAWPSNTCQTTGPPRRGRHRLILLASRAREAAGRTMPQPVACLEAPCP